MRESQDRSVVDDCPDGVNDKGGQLDSIITIAPWNGKVPIVRDRPADRQGRYDDEERPADIDDKSDVDFTVSGTSHRSSP